MFATAVPTAAAMPHTPDRSPVLPSARDEAPALADLLLGLERSGNVRAMEALACTIVRSDWGHISAAAARAAGSAAAGTVADEARAAAGRIARRALADCVDDPSGGATRFHRVGDLPEWARGARPCSQVGEYFFYRL